MINKKKRIIIASDHAGYELKSKIISNLLDLKFYDLGTKNSDSVDYPDYAVKLVNALSKNKDSLGVLICGSGIGMSMVANRFRDIRAALCLNSEMAMLSRQHNDANVLCLGARVTDINSIESIVDAFLETEFEGGRHEKRIKKF